MDEILIAKELAKKLRVDTQRVYEMCRTKSIPFILLGERQYRFSKQAIEKWLADGGNQNGGENNDSH
ncbi:MAG: helix-turn-helix domain-containing protein [Acidobacteria bacterium]|jgi:excisionase family DNA binding protein|nr:helix-turn-helix domain-containing protein [Acidobacteriota bacterium]